MGCCVIHKDDNVITDYTLIKKRRCYHLNPKLKNKEILEIDSIVVVNKNMTEKLAKERFERSFKRLKKILLSLMNENGDEGDALIALNEIAKAKSQIVDEYIHFVSKLEVKKMLEKLNILENQTKEYINMIRLRNENNFYFEYEVEEVVGLSR